MTAPVIKPWLATAIGEIGTLEAPGNADNPRIVEYHAATAGGPAPDSVAHCSSFVNWCLLQNGIVGTRSKAARSWQTWSGGDIVIEPELGDILLLWRGEPNGPQGHVTWYFGRGKRGYFGLGANQGNEVNVSLYPVRRKIAFIRPRWGGA